MSSIKLILATVFILSSSGCIKKTKKKAEVPVEATAAVSQTTAAASTSKLNNSELKIGMSQEFENFNPLIASMNATTIMSKLAMRDLVIIDANGKWVPQLVKSIPTLDNGGAKIVTVGGVKKIEAVWEILDAAVWGDGAPVICDDASFAIKVASAATVSVGEKEVFTQIEKNNC